MVPGIWCVWLGRSVRRHTVFARQIRRLSAMETHFETVFVGCAGWGQVSGSAHFSGLEGSQLERYASSFSVVEINSSFYRAHRRTTYAAWAGSVPQAFRFSVKLPRTITHALRLGRVDALVAQFKDETAGLGEKLGCVLVQLPPSLQLDIAVADSFFAHMRANFSCMVACEARHPAWFTRDATAMLSAHAITRVIADPPEGQIGAHEPTTRASYRRLHGSPSVYFSSYPDAYLAQLAEDLVLQARPDRPAWVIFDNTAVGAALTNALAVLDHIPDRVAVA